MSLDKAKLGLTKEIEEMTSRVDQANVLYSHAEKKIKQMDKVIAEWKIKADGISMELNNRYVKLLVKRFTIRLLKTKCLLIICLPPYKARLLS